MTRMRDAVIEGDEFRELCTHGNYVHFELL
jgi:hypothetical protein